MTRLPRMMEYQGAVKIRVIDHREPREEAQRSVKENLE